MVHIIAEIWRPHGTRGPLVPPHLVHVAVLRGHHGTGAHVGAPHRPRRPKVLHRFLARHFLSADSKHILLGTENPLQRPSDVTPPIRLLFFFRLELNPRHFARLRKFTLRKKHRGDVYNYIEEIIYCPASHMLTPQMLTTPHLLTPFWPS